MKIRIEIKDGVPIEEAKHILYEACENINDTLDMETDEHTLLRGGVITDEATDEVLAKIYIEEEKT